MTIDLRPWRRLLAVWLPAVGMCLVTAVFYVWQTSESGGRRAQIRSQIEELEREIDRLEAVRGATISDRESVVEINRQFDLLHDGIAETLEEIWTKFNPDDKHGITSDMDKVQLNDLIEYLKTL